MVHEGLPGHWLQFSSSWRNPREPRRHWLDSIANEGLAFYFEDVMLQAGLFDDRPRTRGTMFKFARLRALRAITDVQLATGKMTEADAIALLVNEVPMTLDEATGEVATRLATPGQGMSYVLGKHQLMQLLQEQRWLKKNNISNTHGDSSTTTNNGRGINIGTKPNNSKRLEDGDGAFDLLTFHNEREVQGNLPFALQSHLHAGCSSVDLSFENVHTLFPGVLLGETPAAVVTASAALLQSKGYVSSLPGQLPGARTPLIWTGYVDTAVDRSLFYLLVHGDTNSIEGGTNITKTKSLKSLSFKDTLISGGIHTDSGSNNDTLPLVLWLQGGNGCSSMLGLFTENGPFASLDGKTLTKTATSWHHLAHVAYLDRPAGAGFSFASPPYPGGQVNYSFANDNQTAIDSVVLLKGMLADHPWLCDRKVWVAGESYAGHFVVEFAHEIDMHKADLCVDLAGVMVGNGVVDINQTNYAWFEGGYTHNLVPPSTWEGMKQTCNFGMDMGVDGNGCPVYQSQQCQRFTQMWLNQSGTVSNALSLYNYYADACILVDESNGSGTSIQTDDCIEYHTTNYLNNKAVRSALHVDARAAPWSSCSNTLNNHYACNDTLISVVPLYLDLLRKGHRVLIYSGDTDGIVPTLASHRWVNNAPGLELTVGWRSWKDSSGQLAGFTEIHTLVDGKSKSNKRKGANESTGNSGSLVFATVRGAGHMVPRYQPERAFDMVARFLNDEPL